MVVLKQIEYSLCNVAGLWFNPHLIKDVESVLVCLIMFSTRT
jgi:hypothetical protein